MDENLTAPRLVVWIVNYRSAAHVAACLESLSGEGVDAVYVLDNGSGTQDEAALRLLGAENPLLTVFYSEQNAGFGAGVNRISKIAPSRPDDIIWVLNPDIVVARGATKLLREAVERRATDVVSPVILSERRRRIQFSGGRIDRLSGAVQETQLGSDPEILSETQEMLPTEFMSGAAPMMRRASWDRLGGFREDLFLYWEDTEWSIRAQSVGVTLGVLTTATVAHADGASSKGDVHLRAKALRYMSRNRILVCRDRGARGFALVFGAGAIGLLRLAGHALVRGGAGRMLRTWAVFAGAAEALRLDRTHMSVSG